MNQEQKDNFARALGISPEVQAKLDAGSNHLYDCRCEECRQWWKLMGEDGGPGGGYGPFTREEIERP